MRAPPPILRDTLLVVLVYMAARYWIYSELPVHTAAEWSRRDALMCLPRLAAFLALRECNRQRWGNAVPFNFAAKGRGFLLPALLLVGAESLRTFVFGQGPAWPLDLALVGLAATVPVVLFEEYAFRGGILHGLASRFGRPTALLGGSVLFTVFHLQAQPFSIWPAIFLLGLVWSGLRLRGLGLGWLALIHFIVDGLYFAKLDFPSAFSGPGYLYHGLLLVAAVWAWPKGGAKE